MRATIIASVLLLVLGGASAKKSGLTSSETDQWSFQHYQAVADFKSVPAKPVLITPRSHANRTQIRTQAANGPNFAGHFTLAKWGCGSPCLAFVIIDARSGTVYDPGFSVGCADKKGMGANIEFKVSSSLLITTGFSQEGGCGTDFYEWDGRSLNFLHFQPRPDSTK